MTSRTRLRLPVSPSRRNGLADMLAPRPDDGTELMLEDGSRVAVIGGGPAGSFFAYFLLQFAERIDLELEVDIYEPRQFVQGGPAGCNHCGGIVSESLVQILAVEGINLPPAVVQRGIESYVLHMDIGSVRIDSPVGEQRIASVYRGNGPRGGEEMPWDSFDGFLAQRAGDRGARVIRKLVTGVDWTNGLPRLRLAGEETGPYDLVAVASGINSNLLGMLDGDHSDERLPRTSRTYICEFRSDRETIREVLGDSMHVFLLDIPRLEFAALIPKGDYVTMALLGKEIDQELIQAFLDAPEVKRAFPVDVVPCVCTCSPLINVRGPSRPYGDRVVMIGDSGVTRLYKDGIGAAYRTAKAAAAAAVYHGISADSFRVHYEPACREIATDNNYGKALFSVTHLFRKVRFTRRAVLRMTATEQGRPDKRRMSEVLWNLFTGSAPYRQIFWSTLRPAFIGDLAKNLAAGVRYRANGG